MPCRCACRAQGSLLGQRRASHPALAPPGSTPRPCPSWRAADDAEAQQLVTGARQCGLDGGLFVAFPHSTPAKK